MIDNTELAAATQVLKAECLRIRHDIPAETEDWLQTAMQRVRDSFDKEDILDAYAVVRIKHGAARAINYIRFVLTAPETELDASVESLGSASALYADFLEVVALRLVETAKTVFTEEPMSALTRHIQRGGVSLQLGYVYGQTITEMDALTFTEAEEALGTDYLNYWLRMTYIRTALALGGRAGTMIEH